KDWRGQGCHRKAENGGMSGRRPSLAAVPNGSRERQGRHRGRRQGQEGRRGDQGIVELPRSARGGADAGRALAAADTSQAEESQQEGTGGREVMTKKGKHKQDRDGIVASLLPWSRGRIPPPAGTVPGPYVAPSRRNRKSLTTWQDEAALKEL